MTYLKNLPPPQTSWLRPRSQQAFLSYPLLFLFLFTASVSFGQTPSSILPDLEYFKLTFPLDENGNDYEGVSYNNRTNPEVEAFERRNLVGYNAPSGFSYYFSASGNEVIFRAHCAGALTSPNAYPRCELRETPNGNDEYWSFQDEHELNATFRVTHLPNEKEEVCMLQIKGQDGSSSEEVFRLDYRQDGSQGLHVTINESNTLNDIMDYSLGNTIVSRMYVNNGRVWIELNNTSVSGSRGEWNYDYDSNYSNGYFKAGCYTQSSIWAQKNGVADEAPNAYGEVRFSQLTLGGTSNTCVGTTPANRRTVTVGTTTATLAWNAVPNIDHYKFRHREKGTSSWTTSPSIRNTTSYSISGLDNQTEYEWQVRAKCANGSNSNYSTGWGPDFTTGGSSGGSDIVLLRKRNAMGYALDGGNGGANNQNLYLWTYNNNNVNQKWIEIDRGGGYYTYQKLNTNYCIDGGSGGSSSQNVKIYSCSASNYNQHWKKISMSGGAFRLEKRNASAYSMDGKGGGTNGQNVHLWANNNNNQNQHWIFEVVGSTNIQSPSNDAFEVSGLKVDPGKLTYYPNPFDNNLTVVLPADRTYQQMAIRLVDLMGRTVFQQMNLPPGEQVLIDGTFGSGIYWLQWLDQDGQLLQTEKVVKN